jgi:hypothetical protein
VTHVVEFMMIQVLPPLLAWVQLNLGADVTVRSLGPGDQLNPSVHLLIQLRIPVDGVEPCQRLEPLVAIAVAPISPLVSALLRPGPDAEINEAGRVLRREKRLLHFRHYRVTAQHVTLGPEATRPMDGSHVDRPKWSVLIKIGITDLVLLQSARCLRRKSQIRSQRHQKDIEACQASHESTLIIAEIIDIVATAC